MLRSGGRRHVERHEHDALILRASANDTPQNKHAAQVTIPSLAVCPANIALEPAFRYNPNSSKQIKVNKLI